MLVVETRKIGVLRTEKQTGMKAAEESPHYLSKKSNCLALSCHSSVEWPVDE